MVRCFCSSLRRRIIPVDRNTQRLECSSSPLSVATDPTPDLGRNYFLLKRWTEIVERFGKDNCRILSICVRSGAAKYRANQLHIDSVLVSGTRGRRFKSSQARHYFVVAAGVAT